MGDSEAAAEKNRKQLCEAREGVEAASQKMRDIAQQMDLTAIRLEQAEFAQAQVARRRKQWLCESCLTAHAVSAEDGPETCCDTCGVPRSVSDAQRAETENFHTQLSLAKQARAMEGRWAAVQGRVGQVKSGVLLNGDIAVQLQYSDDLSLSVHLNLYELDGPLVATEAAAAGTEGTSGVDAADDGTEVGVSGSTSAQSSDRVSAQQQPDVTPNAKRTRAIGPEAIQLQLLTFRREMGEMEWALKSAEKEHTTMAAAVKRLEPEAALIQCELEAKRMAVTVASAVEERRGYEVQLEAARRSGADAAAEIQMKTASLSETEAEMRQLAAKMREVKARTDAMAARVAEVRTGPCHRPETL
jgi:hypothetical protein